MSEHVDNRTPANYYSTLSMRVGALAGVIGSIVIILVITPLAIGAGLDAMLSPRVIASVLLGEAAATGFLAVVVGTLMHFAAGAMYGAVFAYLMPRMPRAFWFVAGILFGVAIWAIASLAMPPFVPFEGLGVEQSLYFSALIVSHVTYGIVLGLAGSFYGDRATG
jgi:hypothetical protein